MIASSIILLLPVIFGLWHAAWVGRLLFYGAICFGLPSICLFMASKTNPAACIFTEGRVPEWTAKATVRLGSRITCVGAFMILVVHLTAPYVKDVQDLISDKNALGFEDSVRQSDKSSVLMIPKVETENHGQLIAYMLPRFQEGHTYKFLALERTKYVLDARVIIQ